jgi:hypothetical protein
MNNKSKAKCPYFDSLFGYPKRYGITCWIPENQEAKSLDFAKWEKNERDAHFENVCCGGTFYMCGLYPVKYPNGWLHPDGEFFQTPYCQHGPVAMWLEEKLKLKPQFNDYGSIVHGEQLLEVLGWIKIYSSPDGSEGHIFLTSSVLNRNGLTDKQMKYLESIKEKMVREQIKDYEDLLKICE